MRALRQLALVLFFLGLAGLEIAHGVFRLDVLREERERALQDTLARAHAELARELRGALEERRRHAAWLARSPDVLALLTAAPAGRDAARAELEARMLPYLVAFPGLDRVRLLDAGGVDRSRCERIGGGVGALPAALLPREPDVVAMALAGRAGPGEVVVSEVIVDAERVEVAERDRLVLNFVAGVDHRGERDGLVVLSAYAAPLLDAVRGFSPFEGAEARLVDGAGRVLAGGAADEEPPGLVLEAEVLAEPRIRLEARVPADARERAMQPLRREVLWILLSTVALTAVLVVAGAFFVRLSVRAARLQERALGLQREREMERRLALQERLSSVGLLTAGVAHEINNPLEGIGNYLRLLERELGGAEAPTRYVEKVRYGFERIRRIVSDLLSFARPTREPGSATDLAQVVERALSMARYSKELSGTVTVEGLDAPIVVEGEPGQLEQVLLNLLLNAARAMEGRDGRILVRAEIGDREARLVVEDAGPGIPEADLDRIFDPFFTRSGGSGLGLSVSYGIVRAHGGRLTAENVPGGGARFTLGLPRGPRADGRAGEPSAGEPSDDES